MTRQEMFDRAVRGLRAQGWAQCMQTAHAGCAYENDLGQRCAWGHVDTSLSRIDPSVYTLYNRGQGVAGQLSLIDAGWAQQLQNVHDSYPLPEEMEAAYRIFADTHNLHFPED